MSDLTGSHACYACQGAGGEVFLHESYAVWETCEHCVGTGTISWPRYGMQADEDDHCEQHGHGIGCPHDPTDYDTRTWD